MPMPLSATSGSLRDAPKASSTSLRGLGFQPAGRRPRTAASITSAASPGLSCSQTLMTSHPALRSTPSVSRSRAALRLSFASHHWPFAFGRVPWSGQLCQKHPSTMTATRADGNTRSAVRRTFATGCRCTRYRRPLWCSAERKASSAAVPLVFCAAICARTFWDGGVKTTSTCSVAIKCIPCALMHIQSSTSSSSR